MVLMRQIATPLAAYPVGSLYFTLSDASPADLFGGTWERIEGRFLLSADASHAAGSTGGAASHKHTTGDCTLTVDQIPSHTHSVGAHAHGLNSHTHSVGAHAHGLNSHTHTYAKPNTSTGGTSISVANLPKNYAAFSVRRVNGGGLAGAGDGSNVTITAKGAATSFNTVPYESGYATKGDLLTFSGSGTGHSHTIGTTSTNSGGPSTANTANSTAFNSGGPSTANTADSAAFESGSRGGVQRIPTATRETRRACRRTSRSTYGGARRSRVQREGGVAMRSVIELVDCRRRSAACAGGFSCGKGA